MKRHFVQILYPGAIFAEANTVALAADYWNLDEALALVAGERYTPYGFRFVTRERGPDDLDFKETMRSPMYFLNGQVKTVDEVEPGSILEWNMRANRYSRVFVSQSGFAVPMEEGDILCL